jgi:hypothetical protein
LIGFWRNGDDERRNLRITGGDNDQDARAIDKFE